MKVNVLGMENHPLTDALVRQGSMESAGEGAWPQLWRGGCSPSPSKSQSVIPKSACDTECGGGGQSWHVAPRALPCVTRTGVIFI